MNGKVVLAGGTGFIGQYFAQRWQEQGYTVKIISRQEGHISWDDTNGIVAALEGAELLVNLAGRSVNCRYNERNKAEILNSRTTTTEKLGAAIAGCEKLPPVWINSSTATIYRHAEDRPMTEEHGELGSGFSVEVAKAWEHAFFSCDCPDTRQIALRISIVLGPDGGVMGPYRNLVKWGLGGPQGSGKQMFSWIHVEDLYRIVRFLQDHEQLDGVFNCASPQPVSNTQLMRELRSGLGAPIGLPAPAWLLEMGAGLIGTETELILKSRWVIPERLERAGFAFTYPTLKQTLKDIL
ncbi:TIGR01777 family oxidoreductase [Paenibacillus massiliensis]|uniref:TIGR01777 family oxidoreductase n=1 Tax=Paenibacillus massiliensis TaxID=225917 RepID=UPI00037B874D|nr:TIGR01777 family oxidoreductase [Paenibacillus massiliensis]